jgi:hypothetical protein
VTEPTPPPVGRWAGIGEALTRFALATAAAAVGIGVVVALIAWATGRDAARGVADAYYLVGAALFLVGAFPTGGFSLLRGTLSRRKPTGVRHEPAFLVIGMALIALGVLLDVTRPY